MKKKERIAQLEAENERLKREIEWLETLLECYKATNPIVIQPHYDPYPYPYDPYIWTTTSCGTEDWAGGVNKIFTT